MSHREARVQHLNVFLLKESCKQFKAAFRDPTLAAKLVTEKKKGFEAALYVPESPVREPAWVEFLKEGFGDGVRVEANRLSSALLLVKVRGRIFAFTFGHTRSLLKEELFELDFGLMVVVNSVDAHGIRGLSLRMFREMTLKRSEEAAKGTDLRSFTVNVRQDLLRVVTGRPRDSKFATRVSGADSLVIDAPLNFVELGKKCEEMLRAHKEKEYLRQGFRWIENIKEIREPKMILHLDALLVRALRRRSANVQMMTPDSFTRDDIRGFLYFGEKSESSVHPELEIQDWYRASESRLGTLETGELKRRRIRILDTAGGAEPIKEYEFFSFEAMIRKVVFILSNGRWYQIAQDLLKETDEFIKQIQGQALLLNPANKGEVEDDYLARLIGRRKDLASMHKATFMMAGGPIEICDVLSKQGHLVHVKRWSASGTFSHLLRQGAVSAETIQRVPNARKHIRTHVKKFKKEIAQLFPANNFSPGRLTVVFALIRELGRELPFFSKLSLMREAQQVASLGYRVVYQRIGVN